MSDSDRDVYSHYDDDDAWTPDGVGVLPKRKAKLSAHLPVRFAPEVLAAAKRLAAQDGVSISSWIRRLVEAEVRRRTAPVTEPALAWESTLYERPSAITYGSANDDEERALTTL